MNDIEIEIINKLLKKAKFFLIKMSLFMFSIFVVILFIPLKFLPAKRRYGETTNLDMRIVDSPISICIVLGLILLTLIIMYFVSVYNLQKDLKYKEKVIGKVKIKKIEHLSAKITRNMEGNKDTILHFYNNSYGIKDLAFKKSDNPSYLSAKELYIERAKYSKVEFKVENINNFKINKADQNIKKEYLNNTKSTEVKETEIEKLSRLKEKENPNRFMPK